MACGAVGAAGQPQNHKHAARLSGWPPQIKQLTPLELSKLEFVGRALTQLRSEVGGQAAVLGFVGSPWTLATYLIEGASSTLYKNIKSMCYR